MPSLSDWTQIPSGLLDLADKANDAANWAAGQRAQLAETWGNAQRSVLQQMSQTWQQGVNGVQDFAQGFSGQATPGYNDMAGASSRYTDTNAPQPTPGSLSALDQATSPLGPQWGDQTAIPLADVPARLSDVATESRAANLGAVDAYTKWKLGQGPEPTDEQKQLAQTNLLNVGMLPASLENVAGKFIAPAAAPIAEEAGQVRRGVLSDLGNVAQGILGEGKSVVQAAETARPGAIGTENIPLGPQGPRLPTGPLANVGRGALVGAGQGAIGGGIAAGQQEGATPESVGLGALQGAAIGGTRGALGAGLREAAPGVSGVQVGNALNRVVQAGQPAQREGFAGNIRLEKLPQDVQQVVQDTYNAAPQVFEAARRGVISDAEVQQLADQAGTTVQKVVDRWKPGQAQNAETLLALRQTLAAKAKDVLDAQQAVQSSNSAENLLKLQLALKEHAAVQEAVSGVTAEAGRALRQFRQSVTGAIASGNQNTMEELLKKLGGREWTKELADKFGQLDTNDPTQVGTFIRDIYKPKAADYLTEWYYNAILSSPTTHIANSVSNTLNAVTSIPERALSGAFEEGVSRLQGRPKQRFVGEGAASAYGLLRGLPEGVQAAAYTMSHGFTPEQALSGIKGEGKFRGQAFKGPIGTAINVPSRLLNAADALMYPVLQRGAQNALIFRQAKSEGLSGKALADRITELTANVPANIVEQSAKDAEYRLYRQAPGTFGRGAVQMRDTDIFGFQPARFIVPFLQVPINATKYGLERSPLGFINAAYKLAKSDPSASDSLARATIGALASGAIYSQVLQGNLDITGQAPMDAAKRDAFYRQGKLPFAVKLGDRWYSYQRWEPFNHALTQVAAVVDATRNAKAGMSAGEIAAQAGLTEAQNVESQTFLTGISGFLNAVQDPTRYAAQFVSQQETGPLPASGLLRTAANVLDTRQRQPQSALENVQNIIPGLSQNVPSRLNEFGEAQQQPASPLLPYKSQQANMTPLETELQNYGVEPGPTGKTLRGIDLTREEQRAYQQTSGQTVKQLLEQVIRDPRYQAASPGDKQRILQRAILTAKDYAAKQYVGQLATQQGTAALLQRIQQKKNASLPMAAAR